MKKLFGADNSSAATAVTGALPGLLIPLMLFLWIMPGLIGHDLWKADEPYSFGLVLHILQSGDLVVPTLAGEPFMEKPPLFFITAAGSAKLFSALLPLHDGARMASGFYLLLALIFTGLGANELFGKGHAGIAALILAGCPGLQENGHKLITDTSLLAGFSIALYGMALGRRRALPGGIWLGTGAGIGFMSKGMIAPGLLGPVAVMLPLFCRSWRQSSYYRSLLVAFAAALPWFVIWPASLYLQRPDLFTEWFWVQNVGRFCGHHNLGPKNERSFYFTTLPWYAFPALPLAAWSLWREKAAFKSSSALFRFPVLAFLTMLFILTMASDARSLYAMPMLLPLAVLASLGVKAIPGKATLWIQRLLQVVFTLAALLLWCGWMSMLSGYPAVLADKLVAKFACTPHMTFGSLLVAIIYTAGWCWLLLVNKERSGYALIVTWTGGVTLLAGILMTVWLPVIDAGKGYRQVMQSLRAALPNNPGRIASMGLGESERAVAEYYAGVITERVEVTGRFDSDLLLFQTGDRILRNTPGSGWLKVWEGNRPGHQKEAFSLWIRED